MAKAKQTNNPESGASTDQIPSSDLAVEATKGGRTRKAKYILLYSTFLLKETKHELIGEPVMTESGRQQ